MANSKGDLESLVTLQKEQLLRYETRLKDVVTAYKGLLKEKEALELSFKALSNAKVNETSTSLTSESKQSQDESLQLQIPTLINSLATLSAEKSRMEASFQADKKQLRLDIAARDSRISELQEQIKTISVKSQHDVEQVKSKLIVERHEREKQSNDQMVMIRELQKLLTDERHLKENFEIQLNNLKVALAPSVAIEQRLKEVTAELDAANRKLKEYYSGKVITHENSAGVLQQLRVEMSNLKQQHAIAIRNEQKRAMQAEERSKKLAALHEDRVANLEARLAELSSAVGTYDRLRQSDQESIMKLKEKIAHCTANDTAETDLSAVEEKPTVRTTEELIREVQHLKKLLLIENSKLDVPHDLTSLFSSDDDEYEACVADYNRMKNDYYAATNKLESLTQTVDVQRTHLATLQDKIKVLNRNIEDHESELKKRASDHLLELRMERSKSRDIISSMENEFRTKIADLEMHLQKQRDRSLVLLDEKETEIKTLKASFELMPNISMKDSIVTAQEIKRKPNHINTVLNSSSTVSQENETFHILHYAHESARKDVEITNLRKAKNAAESAMRLAVQDKIATQEANHERISTLEEQIDRLERCHSREGANLEYLKNVVLSFLTTTDQDSKRPMLNAISAVLKFSPAELRSISISTTNRRDKK